MAPGIDSCFSFKQTVTEIVDIVSVFEHFYEVTSQSFCSTCLVVSFSPIFAHRYDLSTQEWLLCIELLPQASYLFPVLGTTLHYQILSEAEQAQQTVTTLTLHKTF